VRTDKGSSLTPGSDILNPWSVDFGQPGWNGGARPPWRSLRTCRI